MKTLTKAELGLLIDALKFHGDLFERGEKKERIENLREKLKTRTVEALVSLFSLPPDELRKALTPTKFKKQDSSNIPGIGNTKEAKKTSRTKGLR